MKKKHIIMIDKVQKMFFSLIRVALGTQCSLENTPLLREWYDIFQIAKKQTMLGICFYGIQKLPQEEVKQLKKDRLFTRWLGLVVQIEKRNEELNRKCQEVVQTFHNDRFQCCILKGQGIALSYDIAMRKLRQSGDIDLWINTDIKTLIQKLGTNGKIESIGDHHVNLYTEDNVEIEYHYVPCTLHNAFSNYRIQKWMHVIAKEQFTNTIETDDGYVFRIPTLKFNLIFLMAHMHRHFFGEGLGMRQVLDYYFILKKNKGQYKIDKLLKDFALSRFAHGLMWIMQEIFLLDKDCLICAPNEKLGRFILDEIIRGGNFGHYDNKRRPTEGSSHWYRFFEKIKAGGRYFRYFPSEFFWTPFAYAKEYVCALKYQRQ